MSLSHVGRELHRTLLFSVGLLLRGISSHASNTPTLPLKRFDCTASEDDQKPERRIVKEERGQRMGEMRRGQYEEERSE